jgi:hypothetical protein
VSDLSVASVELSAQIDANDIVRGLNRNDDSIFMFIVEMLNETDSVELEERLLETVRDRVNEKKGLS